MLEALQKLRTDVQAPDSVDDISESMPSDEIDVRLDVDSMDVAPQVAERASLPRNRPSIFTGAPKSIVSPELSQFDGSDGPNTERADTPATSEPARTAMVTDRPGHYQHLITSMESTQTHDVGSL